MVNKFSGLRRRRLVVSEHFTVSYLSIYFWCWVANSIWHCRPRDNDKTFNLLCQVKPIWQTHGFLTADWLAFLFLLPSSHLLKHISLSLLLLKERGEPEKEKGQQQQQEESIEKGRDPETIRLFFLFYHFFSFFLANSIKYHRLREQPRLIEALAEPVRPGCCIDLQ